MKTKKSLALFLATMMVTGGTFALSACGGNSVEGTYTQYLDAEALSGKTFRTGFITAMASYGTLSQTNTLELDAEGGYTLTKDISIASDSSMAENGYMIHHVYIYSGTYTNDKTTVTLSVPTSLDASEFWGALDGQFDYLESFEHRGLFDYTAESYGEQLINFFNGAEWKLSGQADEQKVTLEKSNNSFEYVNLEDEE